MKKLIVLLFLVIFLAACSSESKARNTVDDYLDAVKNGDDYDHYLGVWADGFIDVFDYEYLKTLSESKEKNTHSVTRDSWKMRLEGGITEANTFEKYVQEMIELLYSDDEIISRSTDEVVFWDGESYNKIYTLLYNVEIANELGQKIYKKAEFTVKEGRIYDGSEIKDGFEITDIYLR